jgi:hypothetical protein
MVLLTMEARDAGRMLVLIARVARRVARLFVAARVGLVPPVARVPLVGARRAGRAQPA